MNKEELVNLCKEGNEQALSRLYTTYANKMRLICSRYVPDEQTVSDLLHDGFIIIFTSIHTLRSPEKLESWMGKIMKNMALKYLEQYHSATVISIDEIQESEEPRTTSYANDFPSYAEMLQMTEALPEGYRNVFKLAVLEGLSHKEIGSLLHIAPHSSSSQLSRAKRMLRKLLSQYHTIIALLIGSFITLCTLLLHTSKETAYTSKENIYTSKETDNSPSRTIIRSTEREDPDEMPSKDTADNLPVHIPAHPYIQTESTPTETSEKEVVPQVHIAERKDSASLYHHAIIPRHATNDEKDWSLALSVSGVNKRTNTQKTMMPGDISSGKPQEVIKKSYHHIPITLSFSLRKKINEHWGIETGLQYTYLHSEFTTISDFHLQETQKISYMGIPLKGTCNVWSRQKFSIYISSGVTLDIPVKATSTTVAFDKEGGIISDKKGRIHPPLQWSANAGIGVQYQLTPAVGIYAEPNLHYYFNKQSHIQTIRTEKPCNVALPVGIRLSW